MEEQLVRICDLTYLENFAGGDQHFIRQMIELFFAQVPDELNNLKQQLYLQNLAEVKLIAHKLKSSVLLLGAECMAIHLIQIEALSTCASDGGVILAHYEALVNLNEEAVKELELYLAGVEVF